MRRNQLVTIQWLAPRLHQVQVVDATWFLPPVHGPRDALLEYLSRRIPTAVRFDLDALSDPREKELPHMLAPPAWFKSQMEKLGLASERPIVVYDALGQFSAARAWWNLTLMGGKDVMLLDGGLPAWLAQRLPVASGPPPPPQPSAQWILPARLATGVASLADVQDFVNSKSKPAAEDVQQDFGKAGGRPAEDVQFVDARPAGRFHGVDPEPRPGLRSGHIPHSLSLPFKEVLNADGTFKSREHLVLAFKAAGVDVAGPRRPTRVICTCGSGTTAAVVSFALSNFLSIPAPIYDGSFAQWARTDAPDRPVLKSAAL
jgi:thiosulfate/3-mercaptopyruvate sulfurtransferase